VAKVKEETLRLVVTNLEGEMREAGLLAQSEWLGLDIGSKTYGRAYRLYVRRLEDSAHHADPIGLGAGFIGMTSGEAYQALLLITRTLAAVRYAK